MVNPPRFVADTNVLVSRLVFSNSVPAQAIRHATSIGELIVSLQTLEELEEVLFRPKFDRYVTVRDRLDFLDFLKSVAEFIHSVPPLSVCRDPNDDKFLAVALTGRADFILTGDQDLLVLHQFRGIDIITPRQYFDRHSV